MRSDQATPGESERPYISNESTTVNVPDEFDTIQAAIDAARKTSVMNTQLCTLASAVE